MGLDQNNLRKQAVSLLREACSDFGIMASPIEQDNYRRLWSRDSMVAGIAGLLAGDKMIMQGFKRSIQTLAKYQHPYGMIPSNVLPSDTNPDISYGGLAGRVDATSWFIVGACLYLSESKDEKLKKSLQPNLIQALEILDRWEFNGKGLLYTPLSGNWADEYPIEGHTLYDNLLRAWGIKLYAGLYNDRGRNTQADVIRERIAINFWPDPAIADHPAVYHKRSFKETAEEDRRYFACCLGPKGYNNHFDVPGNGLALLMGLVDEDQLQAIGKSVATIFKEVGASLLPAFWPVIKPGDSDWDMISQNYSFDFKNEPHHFHNGGIWPVWMGLFGLGMSKAGAPEIADRMLKSWMSIEDPASISFCEYLASDTLKRCGKKKLSYSASGLIFLLEALNQNSISKLFVHNEE